MLTLRYMMLFIFCRGQRYGSPMSRTEVTRITVDFPTETGFPLLFWSFRLTESVDTHDTAVISFRGRLADVSNRLKTGTAVLVTLTSGTSKKVWTGYVHRVEVAPTSTPTVPYATRVFVIGATYILKDTVQKIYKNVTADQVVTKIAKANGLKAITERHPTVRKTVSITGQTEWQAIRRMGKQTGFSIVSDNTNIYFMSKDTLIEKSKAKSIVFSYEVTSTEGLPSILRYKVLTADGAPELAGAKINRVLSGIHAHKRDVIKSKHSPSYKEL
jgi:uncharacterized protein involved in type VI secretion and phage assembly